MTPSRLAACQKIQTAALETSAQFQGPQQTAIVPRPRRFARHANQQSFDGRSRCILTKYKFCSNISIFQRTVGARRKFTYTHKLPKLTTHVHIHFLAVLILLGLSGSSGPSHFTLNSSPSVDDEPNELSPPFSGSQDLLLGPISRSFGDADSGDCVRLLSGLLLLGVEPVNSSAFMACGVVVESQVYSPRDLDRPLITGPS